MFRILLGTIVAAFCWSSSALAAKDRFMAFNLGLLYDSSSVESSGGDQTQTRTVINFHGGFFPFGGFIVGVRHFQVGIDSSVTTNTSATTTTTVTASTTTSGTGIHVGYYAESGFLIQGSYLFNPEFKTSGVSYYGGSAYVADAGWMWTMGDFGFGAQLTYSNFIFKKAKIDGVESEFTEDEKWIDMFPMGFAALFF